jgi:hypothetical protein
LIHKPAGEVSSQKIEDEHSLPGTPSIIPGLSFLETCSRCPFSVALANYLRIDNLRKSKVHLDIGSGGRKVQDQVALSGKSIMLEHPMKVASSEENACDSDEQVSAREK